MSYDPWQFATTKNGYHADEVISALQKCIRRGLEEKAAMFAYELYLTSPELEEKMWSRLMTISVEDIAKELNVSASHLAHSFKKQMNISIHKYILKKKLSIKDIISINNFSNNSKIVLDERPTEGNTTHGVSSDGIFQELKETVGNIQTLLQNV